MDEMVPIVDMTIPNNLGILMDEIRSVNTTAVAFFNEVPRSFAEKLFILA